MLGTFLFLLGLVGFGMGFAALLSIDEVSLETLKTTRKVWGIVWSLVVLVGLLLIGVSCCIITQ